MPFVGSLATHRLGLSPIEALVAVTRNPLPITLLNSTPGQQVTDQSGKEGPLIC